MNQERTQKKRAKYNDPFWHYVEKTDDGSPFKCKFCESTFAASTSISRFKYHLSGERGKGVGVCQSVPADVQAAAYQAMQRNKEAIPPNVEPQSKEQDMEMEDRTDRTRWEELMVIDEAGGSRASQGQGGYLSDMLDTEILTGSRTMEGFEFSDQVGVPEEHGTDISDGVVENLTDRFASGASIVTGEIRVFEGLDAHIAKGEPLLTTKLVGQASDKNMEMIWSWLMKDDVLRIGIYGMGGVGKTVEI